MKRKIVSLLLVSALTISALTGCGDSGQDSQTSANGDAGDAAAAGDSAGGSGEIKEFTAFFATPGTEINDDNEIQQIIAEKTGAKCKETWLTGQSDTEAIGTLIASGEYPDFIEGGSGTLQLYEAGALVALDDYIDNYPNIKAL